MLDRCVQFVHMPIIQKDDAAILRLHTRGLRKSPLTSANELGFSTDRKDIPVTYREMDLSTKHYMRLDG